MSRLSDVIFLGPRLAIAVGGEAARRVPSLLAVSARTVSDLLTVPLRDSAAGTSAEGFTERETPAAREPEARKVEDEAPEVVPNVPQAIGGGFPEPSGKDPGDLSGDPSPHHALSAPVGAPDPTEWPDPYENREDPRDPPDPDAQAFGDEPHPPVGGTSTSDPHPDADIEAPGANPPDRDKLDN
jgi:hypothetical protein